MTARLALQRYSAAVVPRFHLLQRQHIDSQSSVYRDIQVNTSRRIHTESIEELTSHVYINILVKFCDWMKIF